jgi:mRNA interferase MazF
VVFDSGDADVVIARLTTKSRQSQEDVTLNDWASAGLRAPSIVRLHKLLTIEKSMVQCKMGTISAVDHRAVSGVLNSMFGSW